MLSCCNKCSILNFLKILINLNKLGFFLIQNLNLLKLKIVSNLEHAHRKLTKRESEKEKMLQKERGKWGDKKKKDWQVESIQL